MVRLSEEGMRRRRKECEETKREGQRCWLNERELPSFLLASASLVFGSREASFFAAPTRPLLDP